jgi:UDP-N-acetyl-D-mannosaminuronic acid dehydrogenase
MPMAQVINLNAEDSNSIEKRSKYTVSIVGCGQKGIVYANAFAEAGFKVLCTDSNPNVVKKVSKGKTAFCDQEAETKLKDHITRGQIIVISDLKKAISLSNIIVIAFTTKVDEQTKSDAAHTLNVCKQVGSSLQRGALVIYGGIAGLGFIEGTVKETLENTSGFRTGKDFGLAYNPIQTSNGAINELIIAANDKNSLQAASHILKTLSIEVKEVSNIKTAEVLKLFAIARRDVNAALANELATFCEKASVDYFEILKLLAPSDPTFGTPIMEEENKNEAYLLLESAENLNVKLRLPPIARQINEDMFKHIVNLTQEALRSCNKTLRRAKIAIFGSANQASATDMLVKLLESKGAKVSIYYPIAKKYPSDLCIIKSNVKEAVEGADCIIFLSGYEQSSRLNLRKIKPLMKPCPVIVDLVGKFQQLEVKKEGFMYCGLGRGTG